MTRMCAYAWTTNSNAVGSNHMCGKPHGHGDDKHKCASCDETHDTVAGALPLEQAVRGACKPVRS